MLLFLPQSLALQTPTGETMQSNGPCSVHSSRPRHYLFSGRNIQQLRPAPPLKGPLPLPVAPPSSRRACGRAPNHPATNARRREPARSGGVFGSFHNKRLVRGAFGQRMGWLLKNTVLQTHVWFEVVLDFFRHRGKCLATIL